MNRFKFDPRSFGPLLEGDGSGAGGGTSSDNANTGGQTGGEGGQQGNQGGTQPFAIFPDSAAFTARMDREANSRLEALAKELGFDTVDAMKSASKDAKTRAEAEQTELEREKAAREKAENDGKAAITTANSRVITAEAKLQASELGIKAERIAYALKLADLSAVTIGADGEPDAAAIKAALEVVIKDIPELAAAAGATGVGTGSNPGAGNTGKKNPWLKESFNLTEQGRILRENPTLAQQYKAAATG